MPYTQTNSRIKYRTSSGKARVPPVHDNTECCWNNSIDSDPYFRTFSIPVPSFNFEVQKGIVRFCTANIGPVLPGLTEIEICRCQPDQYREISDNLVYGYTGGGCVEENVFRKSPFRIFHNHVITGPHLYPRPDYLYRLILFC